MEQFNTPRGVSVQIILYLFTRLIINDKKHAKTAQRKHVPLKRQSGVNFLLKGTVPFFFENFPYINWEAALVTYLHRTIIHELNVFSSNHTFICANNFVFEDNSLQIGLSTQISHL